MAREITTLTGRGGAVFSFLQSCVGGEEAVFSLDLDATGGSGLTIPVEDKKQAEKKPYLAH